MNITTLKTHNCVVYIICIISMLTSSLAFSQAVTNGSVTGAPVGNSMISSGSAAGWSTASGSPDLCNVGFPNYSTSVGLTPCASPDGGTWLGIAAISAGEMAQTTITGLTVGNTYILAYYGSCFGTGTGIFNNGPAIPQICVGATCQTISIPRVACVWNNYTLTFTATAATMNLTARNISTSNTTYANLDGFRFITPLGVELSSFTAEITESNNVALNWTTNSENNNDYFTVLKSTDAVEWKELERVEGAGNSSITLNYSTIDTRPTNGYTYYKLKQTDFDGQVSYSNIQSIEFESTGIEVYPNPAKTLFEVHGNKDELSTVQLFTLVGEDVSETIQIEYVSDHFVRVNVERLKAGIYILKTASKLVKVHVY